MVGYQEIGCHVMLDVKMTFDRKCRFVAGGHTTEAPASMTYSSVVSRDSCATWLSAGSTEWSGYACVQPGECLLECTMPREDLV